MRRTAFSICCLVPLLGCPGEVKDPGTSPVDPSPDLGSGQVSNQGSKTPTEDLGTTTLAANTLSAVNATVTPPQRAVAPGGPRFNKRPRACRKGPKWIGLKPCVDGDHVYVSAFAKRVRRNAHLTRERIALAVRQALAEEIGVGQGAPLMQSEILATRACGKRSYGLGRVYWRGQLEGVPACEGAAEVRLKGRRCPPWTQRIAWREGEKIYGVGVVEKIRNHDLARKTAKNRAIDALSKAFSVTLRDGFAQADRVLSTTGDQMAQCGRTTYIRVSAPAP